MSQLTAEEVQQLANLLAPIIAEKVLERLPPHICPFTEQNRVFLVNFADNARSVRNKVIGTLVVMVVGAMAAWLGKVVWDAAVNSLTNNPR